MNRTTRIAAAFGLTLGATAAHAFTIDLAGLTVDGEAPSITTFQIDSVDPVVSIEFEFIYDAGDDGANISWGSELVVEIGQLDSGSFTQIGTADGGCAVFGVECEFDLMWDDDSGIYTASGALNLAAGVSIGDATSDWQILLADSFDDAGIDGRFLDGSFITFSDRDLTVIPVPAAVWLFGSALLGMGALRRRQAQ